MLVLKIEGKTRRAETYLERVIPIAEIFRDDREARIAGFVLANGRSCDLCNRHPGRAGNERAAKLLKIIKGDGTKLLLGIGTCDCEYLWPTLHYLCAKVSPGTEVADQLMKALSDINEAHQG